jgi:hypothetical protein
VDRIERSLLEKPQKLILENHFGGLMNSEMKCKNCGFSNQKEEIFYTINLAVKNINTIE